MGYTINDKTKKISLVRGDTLRMKVSISIDGAPYTPQSGDSLRFAMKQSYDSVKVLINKPIPITTCELYLAPQDTKKLNFGKYVYDIEITFANGDVDTFIAGQLELLPEIT